MHLLSKQDSKCSIRVSVRITSLGVLMCNADVEAVMQVVQYTVGSVLDWERVSPPPNFEG